MPRFGCARLWRWAFALAAAIFCVAMPSAAQAQDCNAATSPGTAPPSWQTYCWFDLAGYNDTQARSGAGQNFAISLSDGSQIRFNLRTTSSASSGATARLAPSWFGAAVGNSAFLGIPGRPILYMNNSGSTVTFNFTNIQIVPPPGVASVTTFAFVVADAESTDGSEFLEYTTNGTAWEVLDAVPPISGAQMPVNTGVGTRTFRSSGGGQGGRVGAFIVGSNTPSTVTATMRGSGLQGIMFAVRFASISISKRIEGTRIDASDQFDFAIESTSSGTPLAAGTTTGGSLGPFPAVVLSTASGIPVTLTEDVASGSASALSQYQSRLTCTNTNAASTTPLPVDLETTSYDFGALQFSDSIACIFVNTPRPHISLTKRLGADGRNADTDQFRLRIRDRTANFNVAQVNTTGTGNSFGVDSTGLVQVTPGNSIRAVELARGTTDFRLYEEEMVCTNANAASSTALPTGGRRVDLVPQIGDVISCIVTNTLLPVALLEVEKTSAVISDPTGSANPKRIPGALVEYTITVRNVGPGPVDLDSVGVLDTLPPEMEFATPFSVTFAEGATPSGLDPFDPASMVSYTSATGASGPFDYSPGGTFDDVVTGIRVEPEGVMAGASGAAQPSFTLTYRMRVNPAP